MILEHRGRWVCAHIIQLSKEKEQTTHYVHLRMKKTICSGKDKSFFSGTAGTPVITNAGFWLQFVGWED